MSDRDDKNALPPRRLGSRSKAGKSSGKARDEAPHGIGGGVREATEPPADSPQELARQLRRMALGAAPFQRFTCTSLWIKRIWLAAAAALDPEGR